MEIQIIEVLLFIVSNSCHSTYLVVMVASTYVYYNNKRSAGDLGFSY